MSWKSLSKFRSELMGLACLWVMLHHNAFDWPNALESLKRFAIYGNLGVDIFLLLSGVGLYFAWSKQPPLSDFWMSGGSLFNAKGYQTVGLFGFLGIAHRNSKIFLQYCIEYAIIELTAYGTTIGACVFQCVDFGWRTFLFYWEI